MNNSDDARAAFDQALIDDLTVETTSESRHRQIEQPASRHNNDAMMAALQRRWERAKVKGFRGWFLPPGI